MASGSEAVQLAATSALGNLAFNPALHAKFTSAGAVPPLVLLLQSNHATVQEQAVRALMGLTYEDKSPARYIADAGGILPLVHLLRSSSTTSAQFLAVTVLTDLAAEGGTLRDVSAMKNAGAVPLLAKLKDNAQTEAFVREGAATLLQLLQQSDEVGSSPSVQEGHQNSVAPHPASSSRRTSAPITVFAPAPAPPEAAAAAGPSSTPSSAPTAAAGSAHSPFPAPAAGGTRPSIVRTKKLCWSCGATGVPLKKCSVCAVAAYCGAGCQKADWKAHKGQCAGLKAGASGSGSIAAGDN